MTAVRFALVPYTDVAATEGLSARERTAAAGPRGAERAAAMHALHDAVVALWPELRPGDVEVVRREGAAPRLLVHGEPSSASACVAHCGQLAVAVVASLEQPVPRPAAGRSAEGRSAC